MPGTWANSLLYTQVNVEILVLDKRSFITDEERALQALFGDANDMSAPYRSELATMGARLASAFAAIKVWQCTWDRGSDLPLSNQVQGMSSDWS